MENQTKVYLRADGNTQIGLGHVHRMLALSQILRDHFQRIFISKSSLSGVRDLILENCDEIIELNETSEENELSKIVQIPDQRGIFVFDGYHLRTNYQREIKKHGHALVCIDDIHSYHFVADVIINPAGGISSDFYSKENYTEVFTGPKFAPIKTVFTTGNQSRTIGPNNSVLICMGGADPNNYTLDVLKQCLTHGFQSINVVIGEAYQHIDLLTHEVSKAGKQVAILSNLKPDSLAKVMSTCSTAICSASGIAYEYLSIGGTLYIIQTVENQSHLYNYLIDENLAFKLEHFPITEEKRANSLARQREIFDGHSDKRIRRIFDKLDFNLNTQIRRARETDLMTTYNWANDGELRRQSYNSDPIQLATHTTWFTKKINDPATVMYIFDYKNKPVAQVRFDVHEDEAIISYSIDALFRGKGWGALVLTKAIKTFKDEYSRTLKISGFVKHENFSSNKIFKSLGFKQQEAREHLNSYKYEYIGS